MFNLAETMRPRTWDDVIGNDHIVRALQTQIKEGNLSKSILITGISGSGKSTIGKLIASSINAEIFEIDCGADGSVDRIREVVESASMTSLFAKNKVFVLDEVHALSKAAQSALLKTLEESPEGMFVLLTTELNKVLPTIRGRCVIYETKPASNTDIGVAVRRVLEKYNLEVEDMKDFWKVIEAAEGSLRQVYSVMEKLVALAENGVITSDSFRQAIGESANDEIDPHMPKAFLSRNYEDIIEGIKKLKKEGTNNPYSTAVGIYNYLKAVMLNSKNVKAELLEDFALLVANREIEWEHIEWVAWRHAV